VAGGAAQPHLGDAAGEHVAEFHTHPSRVEEDYPLHPGPDDWEAPEREGLPQRMLSHGGIRLMVPDAGRIPAVLSEPIEERGP
jgi:hypothetical protein